MKMKLIDELTGKTIEKNSEFEDENVGIEIELLKRNFSASLIEEEWCEKGLVDFDLEIGYFLKSPENDVREKFLEALADNEWRKNRLFCVKDDLVYGGPLPYYKINEFYLVDKLNREKKVSVKKED